MRLLAELMCYALQFWIYNCVGGVKSSRSVL